MIWNSQSECPGVRKFAENMKEALMKAHDAIIEAHSDQMHQANKHSLDSPFKEGALVYLSTKNLRLPKVCARKLVPKYLGLYCTTQEIVPSTTFKLDLPKEMLSRGSTNVFHPSLCYGLAPFPCLTLYLCDCD